MVLIFYYEYFVDMSLLFILKNIFIIKEKYKVYSMKVYPKQA